ncbi:uncharacterized protein [Procambarus clarkii]|uniref:uncharacterized protein n=1 Tax=Procambarus clarkii TaxID=6728 RepID=UPI0037439308
MRFLAVYLVEVVKGSSQCQENGQLKVVSPNRPEDPQQKTGQCGFQAGAAHSRRVQENTTRDCYLVKNFIVLFLLLTPVKKFLASQHLSEIAIYFAHWSCAAIGLMSNNSTCFPPCSCFEAPISIYGCGKLLLLDAIH